MERMKDFKAETDRLVGEYIEELEEENKKLKSDLAYERTMLDNVRAEYKSLQDINKKLKERIDELEKCNLNLQERLDRKEELNKSYRKEIDDKKLSTIAEETISDLQARIKELKERIDVLYEFIERNDKLVDEVIDEEDLDKLNRYIYIDDDLVDRTLESED